MSSINIRIGLQRKTFDKHSSLLLKSVTQSNISFIAISILATLGQTEPDLVISPYKLKTRGDTPKTSYNHFDLGYIFI
jgi:hypothetical protein